MRGRHPRDALTKARPTEVVGFILRHGHRSSFIQTSGTLCVSDGALLFTLSEFRHQPQSGMTDASRGRTLPDTNGLDQRTVHFSPDLALREDLETDRTLPLRCNLTSLVIDYRRLGKLAAVPPAVPPSSPAGGPSNHEAS